MSDQRTSQQRTTLQNRAMHKYFSQMSESLDSAGYDQVKFYETIKHGFKVSWTPEAFKTFFRSVAVSLYPDVVSTADLTTKQLMQVYDIVDRGISESTGISISWPSNEPPLLDEHGVEV